MPLDISYIQEYTQAEREAFAKGLEHAATQLEVGQGNRTYHVVTLKALANVVRGRVTA